MLLQYVLSKWEFDMWCVCVIQGVSSGEVSVSINGDGGNGEAIQIEVDKPEDDEKVLLVIPNIVPLEVDLCAPLN